MNATIQVLKRFTRFGWIQRRKERATVLDLVKRLEIRAASVEQPVQFLSGGNQQKVALARPFLRGSVRVILAEEPTQGVDIRSRFDIYEALRTKASDFADLSPPLGLAALLEEVSLVQDVDSYDDGAGGVTLITLHTAKVESSTKSHTMSSASGGSSRRS